MGVLSESLCFCKGVGKSERMKAAIFTSKTPIMARISSVGTGFLVHRNLLLTTHANLPSLAAAESTEIQLQNIVSAILLPRRFFITSSILDLTIVSSDYSLGGDSNSQNQHPLHFLRTCQKANLDLGGIVYLLGYNNSKELSIGEGKVVVATDNLIKLSTNGVVSGPGSAGFDSQGNLAFMVCDPMKLATSPNTKSSSTSSSSTSSSSKRDIGARFGIPIPIIYDWLNQHWEGSLDEPINKPKLPIFRLMSTGPRVEHASASFTLRRVFKSTEADDGGGTPCSSKSVRRARDQAGTGFTVPPNTSNGMTKNNACCPPGTRLLGTPTPEINETPKVTWVPIRRKESNPIQLLDINFPPRFTETPAPLQPPKLLIPPTDENSVKEVQIPLMSLQRKEEDRIKETEPINTHGTSEVSSSASVHVAQSEVHSCASPLEASEMNAGFSSEEETMYSAETAESRNYTSPREGRFQEAGRSQSCVSYGRWAPPGRSNATARRSLLEKQGSFIHGRKVYSRGAKSNSHGSNDYYSPTMSSIMKTRNNSEHRQQQSGPRQYAVNSSPRWVF